MCKSVAWYRWDQCNPRHIYRHWCTPDPALQWLGFKFLSEWLISEIWAVDFDKSWLKRIYDRWSPGDSVSLVAVQLRTNTWHQSKQVVASDVVLVSIQTGALVQGSYIEYCLLCITGALIVSGDWVLDVVWVSRRLMLHNRSSYTS